MAEGEEKEDRKYPPNLEGVLRFCVENTKSEDAKDSDAFAEMTQEVRK